METFLSKEKQAKNNCLKSCKSILSKFLHAHQAGAKALGFPGALRPSQITWVMVRQELLSAYFGSGGPSPRGFMDSLQRERNTRKASFCRM